ncbi:MAG: TetR/AcrR family transcriptional regulator [Proteobacteria bacterium]|nr:TetR/AcrR family transcriptional regulator [Pseudomonadota bacterium]MBU1059257.1 TetR/AcrR family transcriptional regulator [Pseudomonadota bacterium]
MSRRDDSKAETRELILGAAQSMFWEKGVDRCTIRDIAVEAGVSPATIIVHFRNKTALLEASLHEDIEKAFSKAQATMPVEDGLYAVLLHMVSSMFSFYDRNRELYRILIRDTFYEPDHENPTMLKMLHEKLQLIAILIEQEKSKGTVRDDADSFLAASSFFFLYIGVLGDLLRDPELSVASATERFSAILGQHLTGILIRGEGS